MGWWGGGGCEGGDGARGMVMGKGKGKGRVVCGGWGGGWEGVRGMVEWGLGGGGEGEGKGC